MNIYEKLSKITNEITNVNKNLSVGVGKNSYKAVGEADVLYAVKQMEEKYKVYSYPYDRKIVTDEVLEYEKEYDGKVTKGNQIFMRIETTYRFINIEKPEEYVDIKSYGDGIDTQDKAPGKAMTYADKYALLKCYKIITGDDPDQNASEKTNFKKTTTKKVSTNREELIKYCKENNLDVVEIGKKYNLTKTSTDDDYKKVLTTLMLEM